MAHLEDIGSPLRKFVVKLPSTLLIRTREREPIDNKQETIVTFLRNIHKLVVKMAERNDSPGSTSSSTGQENQQLFSSFIGEIIKSPVNLALVGVIALLVYKIVKSKTKTETPMAEVKTLPKLRCDFTVEELRKYDGTGPDERLLVAVNGSVYDCSIRGARFYGPGKHSIVPVPTFRTIVKYFPRTSRTIRRAAALLFIAFTGSLWFLLPPRDPDVFN